MVWFFLIWDEAPSLTLLSELELGENRAVVYSSAASELRASFREEYPLPIPELLSLRYLS